MGDENTGYFFGKTTHPVVGNDAVDVVPCHVFFQKLMFQIDSPEQARHFPAHVDDDVFGTVLDAVAGQVEERQVWEFPFQQVERTAIGGEVNFDAMPLHFPDDGYAAGGVAEAPVERGDEDAFLLAQWIC